MEFSSLNADVNPLQRLQIRSRPEFLVHSRRAALGWPVRSVFTVAGPVCIGRVESRQKLSLPGSGFFAIRRTGTWKHCPWLVFPGPCLTLEIVFADRLRLPWARCNNFRPLRVRCQIERGVLLGAGAILSGVPGIAFVSSSQARFFLRFFRLATRPALEENQCKT